MPEAPIFTRKGRTLMPGQVAELTVIDRQEGRPRVIFTAEEVIAGVETALDRPRDPLAVEEKDL